MKGTLTAMMLVLSIGLCAFWSTEVDVHWGRGPVGAKAHTDWPWPVVGQVMAFCGMVACALATATQIVNWACGELSKKEAHDGEEEW